MLTGLKPREKDFRLAPSADRKVFLEDHPAPQEGETGNHPSSMLYSKDGTLLTSTEEVVGRNTLRNS